MIIVRDTREKEPWDFSAFSEVLECKVTGLKTGDYTMFGYESLLSIERKRNTGEIAINLGSKWSTFEKELIRMKDIPYKYIVCEFPEYQLDIFPEESGIPKKLWSKIRMNPSFLKSRLYDSVIKYNIELIFSSNKQDAERRVFEILKSIKDEHE